MSVKYLKLRTSLGAVAEWSGGSWRSTNSGLLETLERMTDEYVPEPGVYDVSPVYGIAARAVEVMGGRVVKVTLEGSSRVRDCVESRAAR